MSQRKILDRMLPILALVILMLFSQYVGLGSRNLATSSLDTKSGIKAIVPPDGYCYHGAGFHPTWIGSNLSRNVLGEVKNFVEIAKKDVYVYFSSWGARWVEGEPFWEITSTSSRTLPQGQNSHIQLLDEGLVKALGVILWPCLRTNGDDPEAVYDNFTIKGIADRRYDEFIRTQANVVKSFKGPLFIRLGSEFNIHQYPNRWPGAHNWGENPTDFINAWRRYVDIFRSEGASNAIFVWNPNWQDDGPHHWTEYYPGDDYVDWVGIDFYQYDPHSKPEQMIKGVYDDYCNEKPIAITEWGANWEGQNYTDSDRARFINEFFDAVEARPQVKLINYWYCCDFKFSPDTFPLATAAYANRVSNPRYIG